MGQALLAPHRSYLAALEPLLERDKVRALAHITGGGFPGNIPRVLPEGLGARLRRGSWEVPPLFRLIQKGGGVSDEEMERTFNMGVGMVVVVSPGDLHEVEHSLERRGETSFVIGQRSWPAPASPGSEGAVKRIGVLVSGRGSNLQALLDAARRGELGGEVAVVVSNVEGALGLERARQAGIPAVFRDHRGQEARGLRRRDRRRSCARTQVDLVCLAGFMRLLSPVFVRAFPGRIVNIHPALLPAFPGLDAQRQAWEHGAKVSGATVHLVDEGLDSGPIVAQEAVPVLSSDTPETLAARILEAEHRLYPRAVRLLLEGRCRVEGRRVIVEGE